MYSNPGIIAARQRELEAAQAYFDSMSMLYNGAVQDIQTYETDSVAILEGRYTEVTGYQALEEAAWQGHTEKTAGIIEAGGETMAAAAEKAINTTGQRAQEATAVAGFDKAGKQAVEGFAAGFQDYSAVQQVIAKARYLAQQALAALRAGLDEHSPSRAMMEIGELATEGFAIGLVNGLSSVRAAMTKTVNTVEAGMAGAVPTPQPTTASLAAGVVNGLASASPAVGGTLTVNLVMPDGKRLAQETIKDFIGVARANGTPITAF